MTENHAKINGNQTLSKKIILNVLKKIQQGTITLHDGDDRYVFQDINGSDRPSATLNIINPRAYKKILLEGSVGAGKSYIDGDWNTDNLQTLIELFIKNEALFNNIESPFAHFLSWMRTIGYKLNRNTIQRAKDNILAHYDLGNEFFELILDPSMMYSCALYEPSNSSLDEAAKKKLQRICDTLELKPGDHLLEIGTGWGGFAIYAAQEYGCKITTTTISNKQHALSKKKLNS